MQSPEKAGPASPREQNKASSELVHCLSSWTVVSGALASSHSTGEI